MCVFVVSVSEFTLCDFAVGQMLLVSLDFLVYSEHLSPGWSTYAVERF